jgi:hypothetical protein
VTPQVLAVTPNSESFPGVTRVFKEAEGLGLVKHVYANQLRDVPPDAYVLFGAWSEAYALPARRLPNAKGVLWSSPLLQTDLSDYLPVGVTPEGQVTMVRGEHALLMQVADHKSKGVIRDFWVMDQTFAQALAGHENTGVYWFPAPLASLPKATNPKPKDYGAAALFGPWAPRKNVLTQCLAAAMAGFRVHANGAAEYAGVLTALGLNADSARGDLAVVDHGWMPREEYFNTLAGMGVSLCCYLSESFCYAAADAAALEVPLLASPAIRWAPTELMPARASAGGIFTRDFTPQQWKELSDAKRVHVTLSDPSDMQCLGETLAAWRDEGVNKRMGRIARHAVEKYQARANEALKEEFKRAGVLGG